MRFLGYLIRVFFPLLVPLAIVSGYVLTGHYAGLDGNGDFYGLVQITPEMTSLMFYGSMLLLTLGDIMAPIWKEDVPALIRMTDGLSKGLGLLLLWAGILTLQIPILALGCFFALLTGKVLFVIPVACFFAQAYVVGHLTPEPRKQPGHALA